ncbi:anti-sigma factor domain-containing protein [Bacillus sp. 2205SS5-2]|uniref:anti-sigma factor domain-containing protein n=1 Tax=Bacillus sp. 2205SS5-2 TaxID=3109031 RepID=UPI003006FB8C
MKKGIVMEVKTDYLIMMTPYGEFEKATISDKLYVVGEEIEFAPYKERKRRESYSIWAKLASVAAIMFLSFTLIQAFLGKDSVYAYVSVDINPSFEIGVTKDLEVIEITPFNAEAKEMLNSLKEWKNKSVHSVLKSVVAYSDEKGFNIENMIITTAVNKKKATKSNTRLDKEVEEIKTELPVTTTIVPVTLEQRNKAHENGISTGTYIQDLESVTKVDIIEEQPKKSTSNPSSSKDKIEENNTLTSPQTDRADKKKPSEIGYENANEKKKKEKIKNKNKNQQGKQQDKPSDEFDNKQFNKNSKNAKNASKANFKENKKRIKEEKKWIRTQKKNNTSDRKKEKADRKSDRDENSQKAN